MYNGNESMVLHYSFFITIIYTTKDEGLLTEISAHLWAKRALVITFLQQNKSYVGKQLLT